MCAAITPAVSTASEQFRPGRRDKRTHVFYCFPFIFIDAGVLLSFQSPAWIGAAVLLRQRGRSGADGGLDGWQHPGQGSRLGLTSVQGAPPCARVLPLALRRHELLLLLPVVGPLPHLLKPPTFKRVSRLPAAESRSGQMCLQICSNATLKGQY